MLASDQICSADITERVLSAIENPAGQGSFSLRVVWPDLARATAAFQDVLRDHGIYVSAVAGLPITIKDNIDISGEPTVAGATACLSDPPKCRDAVSVARLRQAGAVLVGRANMSEFAFSGLGLNPNFGTPLNPWDRESRRIAGGSSSGSAVSVADGMAVASLATDTGGSVRAPAALCGLVGFKASRAWSPLEGVFPRSFSLDALGIIANSVNYAAHYGAIVAGVVMDSIEPIELSRLTMGLPDGYLLADLDPEVARNFDRAIKHLSDMGVSFETLSPLVFDELRPFQTPGFTPPESAAIHRDRLSQQGERYNRVLRARIEKGASTLAIDYIDLMHARQQVVAYAQKRIADLDAVILPTTPAIAPKLSQIETDAEFERWSARILRNCGIANFLDRPAISLPMHDKGDAPTGLMLVGTSDDQRLLRVAARIESVLNPIRRLS